MHTRVDTSRRIAPRTWLSLVLAAAVWAIFTGASAAQVTPAQPVTIAPKALPAKSIDDVLARGQQLESGARWGEAVSHYEDALRTHHDDETLLQRHDLAKLHYSLEHRYHDRSFRDSIAALTPQQTSALLTELIQKTNTHYVAEPQWRTLAVRGARGIDIALSDQDFRAAHKLQASPEQVDKLRGDVYQLLRQRRINASQDLLSFAAETARLVEARVGVRLNATMMEFVSAVANGLDDYSAYLTGDQLREVYSQIEGNFVGLGVELKADNGALLIVHVIPGSPAERAGIVAEDRIVAVDGQSTSDLSTDEAAGLLTGPEGSWVRVTAYSPGMQPRVLNIRREHVEVPSLEGVKIVDADFGIAYVRIPTFQKTTSRDLEAALWDLHRQGMRSLVLDLRGNPGGLLTSAVEVADKFLTQGNIVSTRGRSAQEDFNYQAHYGGTWRVPLVILIDGDSASASEIFAGAIKDNNRGRIVGATSFGKGSVQGIFPLGYAGAGVRLTTAKFFSPNGTPISHRGVTPHELVETYAVAKPTDEGLLITDKDKNDAVLQAGISAARSRVATRQ